MNPVFKPGNFSGILPWTMAIKAEETEPKFPWSADGELGIARPKWIQTGSPSLAASWYIGKKKGSPQDRPVSMVRKNIPTEPNSLHRSISAMQASTEFSGGIITK